MCHAEASVVWPGLNFSLASVPAGKDSEIKGRGHSKGSKGKVSFTVLK